MRARLARPRRIVRGRLVAPVAAAAAVALVGGVVVAGSTLGFVAPAVAAMVALAVDAFVLPTGTRLLRRVDLRVPRGDAA